MKGSLFLEKKLRTLVNRVENLRSDSAATSGADKLLRVALQELLNAAAELHQAGEELQDQNHNLQASQESLAAERQRYRELFDLLPDACLITDLSGIIQVFNRQAATMLAMPRESLEGRPLSIFLRNLQDSPFSIKDLQNWPPERERRDLQLLLKPRQEAPRPVQVTVMAERRTEGRPTGFLWLIREAAAGVTSSTPRVPEGRPVAGPRPQEVLTLLNIARAILASRDFQGGARGVFELCQDLIGATAGWFALCSQKTKKPEVLFLNDSGQFSAPAPSLSLSRRGLREAACLTGGPVYENNFAGSPWAALLPHGHVPIANALLVPLLINDESQGFFCLANKPGGFADEDVALASACGDLLSLALANARVHEDVRASEERYRSLLDFLPDAVAVHTDRFILVNPAGLRLFGATHPREIIGQPVLDRVHPDNRDLIRERIANVLAHREPSELKEIQVLRLDGSAVTVESTSRDITYRGKPAVVVVLRDITRRRETEATLKETADKLQTLVNTSPLSILSLDTQGAVTSWNPAAERLFGWRAEEVLGRPLPTIPAAGQEEFQELIEQERQGQVLLGKELRRQRRDGSLVDVALFCGPMHNAEGEVVGFTGMLEDITLRKQAEEALKQSRDELERQVRQRTGELARVNRDLERRLEELNQAQAMVAGERQRLFSLLEALPVFVYVRSADFDILYANRLFRQTFGEMHGRKCFQVMADRDRPCENCNSHEVLQKGCPDHWNWTRAGSGQTFEVYSYPFTDPDGTPLALTMGLDITERERALEDLKRRETVLNAVSSCAKILLEPLPWDACMGEVLRRLGEAAQVSRVYIFENHAGPDGALLTSQRWEWVALDVTPQMDNPVTQNLPYRAGGLGRWEDRLSRREIIAGDVKNFPSREQEILAPQDIRSILAVPIFLDPRWWGFIGFGQCGEERRWTAGEIEGLSAAAGLLGSAIQWRLAEEALRESESRYRLLAENIDDVICTADLNLRPTYVSSSVRQLLGYTPEEVMGLALEEIFTPASLDDIRHTVVAMLQEVRECPDLIRTWTLEAEAVCKDGSTIWAETRGSVLRDAAGQPVGFLAVWRDITQRRQAEEALKVSEAQFRSIIEGASVGIALRDLEGRLIACNPVFRTLVGYREEDLQNRGLEQITHPDDIATGRELFARLARGETDHYQREKRYLSKDGRIFWGKVSVSLVRDAGGRPRHAITMFEDITAQKRAEAQQREAEQNLRYLATQLLTAQERERARIALELHDDLGQSLTFLKILMRNINKKLDPDQPGLLEESDQIREYIDGIIQKIRGLSRELMPSILQDLGLQAALKYLFGEFQKHQEVEVALELEDVENLFSREEQLIIYRIFQEALHNIAKHAGATRVEAIVRKVEEGVSFTIADNGRGFAAGGRGDRNTRGLGLASMEERARMLRGTLKIRSAQGKGTRIEFTIPAKAAENFTVP